MRLNTETCGTGRSSGCPPVPCGVRAVPGGLHPCPCPGLMTATMTGFEAPVEPPRCRVLGICSPAPSLGVTAACPALGEALSGPGYAASGAAQLVCVGRWLGTRRGHSTTSLVPSRPQRLALPTRAVQPARYPRKRACVHVYVPALSVVGRLDTGDAPGDAVGRLDPCCYSQEAAETSGRGGQTPNTRRGRGPAHHTVPRACHVLSQELSVTLGTPVDTHLGGRAAHEAAEVTQASLQAKLDQPMPCLPGTPISHSSSGPGASGHSRPELVTSPGLRMDVFGCAEALQPCFCEK
ncbi:unnamed protein product [Rangifer tarandus platyrhynchus]|uniref:Uncharacterized protein n=1 Tax=Rangifer tarandus platyrhynchus TaxID=3082113 RepID=A0AC60A6F2_RANTA